MIKMEEFSNTRENTVDNGQQEFLIESKLRRILVQVLVHAVKELQEDGRLLVVTLLLL
jgi:hypothetical protein